MKFTLCVLIVALCAGFVLSLNAPVSSLMNGGLVEMLNQDDDDDACDTCKKFLGIIKDDLIAEETFNRAIDYTDNLICKELPYWQSSCRVLAEGLVPVVLKHWYAELDPESLCTKITFCSETFEEDFEELVNDVKRYIKRNF